ncbi:hypothetical protein C6499_20560 [Candidatus Poribacteria bacterium]|nr:MAG: hypothetical protein C6499_20560 [Candidatus Poribacteria bacterium]
MLKRYFVGLTSILCLLSLTFFVGCGDPEGTERADLVVNDDNDDNDPEPFEPLVLPDEFYDTSDLTYDISDEEVQELMALEVPDHFFHDPKYFHAQLLQQFGNIPAVHIVAERHRKRLLNPGGFIATLDEAVNYAKARYVLWPNESTKKSLEGYLKDKLMHETEDPELYGKIYKEQLIEQFGNIPEVDILVEGEKKYMFGGFKLPDDADIYLAYFETLYVLFPNASTLRDRDRAREEVRKIKAEE